MDKKLCHIDGMKMKRDERPFEVNYKGLSETVSLPGWYCSCGESLHSKTEMKVADAALKRLKAKEKGVFSPETIRAIRKRLELTQEEAGTLFGGGPRAFQKYESGEIMPSRTMCATLYFVVRRPEMLDELRARSNFSEVSGEDLFAHA
jgi:HTH-type transcriptional regulator / antitoxin MqsA